MLNFEKSFSVYCMYELDDFRAIAECVWATN